MDMHQNGIRLIQFHGFFYVHDVAVHIHAIKRKFILEPFKLVHLRQLRVLNLFDIIIVQVVVLDSFCICRHIIVYFHLAYRLLFFLIYSFRVYCIKFSKLGTRIARHLCFLSLTFEVRQLLLRIS